MEQRGTGAQPAIGPEETGWLCRTVLPAAPHTLLGMGRPCPTALLPVQLGSRSVHSRLMPPMSVRSVHMGPRDAARFPAGPGEAFRSEV